MDCPPPINQQCEVIKDGTTIASIPCTVVYQCSAKIASFDELVKQDASTAKGLLKELEQKP